MHKLIARTLIHTLPLPILAGIIDDKAAQQDRVNAYMKKWGKKPTILDEEEARLKW
jgi:hypothetical protein